jgi:hypothetical protein
MSCASRPRHGPIARRRRLPGRPRYLHFRRGMVERRLLMIIGRGDVLHIEPGLFPSQSKAEPHSLSGLAWVNAPCCCQSVDDEQASTSGARGIDL